MHNGGQPLTISWIAIAIKENKSGCDHIKWAWRKDFHACFVCIGVIEPPFKIPGYAPSTAWIWFGNYYRLQAYIYTGNPRSYKCRRQRTPLAFMYI